MQQLTFDNATIVVVGGAGFVGSNLVHMLLNESPKQIVIIDNLLSSDFSNIPIDPRVRFVFGSVTDAKCLSQISVDTDSYFTWPVITATSLQLPIHLQTTQQTPILRCVS